MKSFFARGRVLPLVAVLLFTCLGAFAQQQPVCSIAATAPPVHAEGLTELTGNITLTCTGGTAGSTASLSIFITLSANITNRLDANNSPQGIAVSISGATALNVGITSLFELSFTTYFIQNINYAVPSTPLSPVTITISGLRAAVAGAVPAGGSPVISATVAGVGAQLPTTSAVVVGVASATLLTSLINNGIPCIGSALPQTLDFASFTALNGVSSTIRVSEGSASAFTVKDATGDTGLRVRVNFSGYTAGSRVFVPDAIVGTTGTLPTSAGAFNSTVSAGTYSPGINQLLMVRVNGADVNGAGGATAFAAPSIQTTFTSVSEVPLTSGAGSVLYEVLSSNVNVREIAQIPTFLVAPQIRMHGHYRNTLHQSVPGSDFKRCYSERIRSSAALRTGSSWL